MLYAVSGFMRTGTSMMMRALEAGGLETAYKADRDKMKNHYADEHYDPNIGGLYELERQDYKDPEFPRKYDGKLIKALNIGIPRMAVMPDGIRVVFMRRDKEEIRQSYDAFFGQQIQVQNLDERMETIKEKILNRKDVISFHEFWFRDVIDRPTEHFQVLKDIGWPIKVGKAVDMIDPKYCRFRLENLTVGIV